jgi:Ca2+-binding RTX toxin-like protein
MPEDILFDLNVLGERGVELAQIAGSLEAAGQIETVNGTVIVRRLNGEVGNLAEGDPIFMGDTLEVSDQSSVGVIFADETTMALGSGAQMVIDEMVYDPNGDSGSLAVSVADGVFSFVSGQISKIQDEGMVINTPVATIGIRGTKGAGRAAPEGSENTITLMPEDDGQIGEMVVRNDGGVQVLNQPGQSLAFSSRFEAPPPPSFMSPADMQAAYGPALNILPPPPGSRPPPLAPELPRSGDTPPPPPPGEAPPPDVAPEDGVVDQAARDAVEAVIAEAAADGEITEEEAAAIEQAIAESGAFGDNEEAVEAATAAYIAAIENGASVEEAAEVALATGQSVVAASEAAEATSELVQEIAENIDGDTGSSGSLFTNAIDGALEDVSQNTDGGTFSNDVGELGSESAEDEKNEDGDDKLVDEELPVDEEIGEEADFHDEKDAEEFVEDLILPEDELLELDASDDFGVEGFAQAGSDEEFGFGDIGLTDPDDLLGDSGETSIQEEFAAPAEPDSDTSGTEEVEAVDPPAGITNINGTTNAEQIVGTSGDDNITADSGDDWVMGDQGNDTINGGAGNDVIYGDGPAIGMINTVSTGANLAQEPTGGASDLGLYGGNVITSDGQKIVFGSSATDLVSGDTNGQGDIFVKDIGTGEIQRISISSDGTQGTGISHDAVISADGRYVAFHTDALNLEGTYTTAGHVYLYDMNSDTLKLISKDSANAEGDGYSNGMVISDDSKFVAFYSASSNLVASDTNGADDIFLYDIDADSLTRVSTSSLGVQADGASNGGMDISSDGGLVVFSSAATNLIGSDGNGQNDIFIKKIDDGSVSRLSVATGNVEATGGGSHNPDITADGKYVVFDSAATDMVAGDTNTNNDIFRHEISTGTTIRVNTTSAAGEATGGDSWRPTISDDGDFVVFESSATNLVSGVSTGTHVYIKQISTDKIEVLDVPAAGTIGSGNAYQAHISGDGKNILFQSDSTDLVPSDGNGVQDIFMVSNPFLSDSAGADFINGGAGNDTMLGGDGNDTYYFEPGFGSDTIFDEGGTDRLERSSGFHSITEGNLGSLTVSLIQELDDVEMERTGNDLIIRDDTDQVTIKDQYNGHAIETFEGAAISQNLSASATGTDIVVGTSANETLTGDNGFNVMFGFDGDDVLNGGTDMDFLKGGNGADTVNGGVGNDILFGGAGIDAINGGDGVDFLIGGVGDDVLTGGGSNDLFYFSSGDGKDTITDFTSAQDLIMLDGASFGITSVVFEEIGTTYDGTNAASTSNVIKDTNGDIYVDNNGNSAGGYSVIANVSGTVVAADVDVGEA